MKKGTGPLDLDLFVGRRIAIEAFLTALNDPERKPIIFFCGEGGVGKTWLLRRLQREVKSRGDLLVAPNTVDLIATHYHRISGVRKEIIRFLGPEHFQRFQKAQDAFEAERDKPHHQRVAESAIQGLQTRADELFMVDCREALKGRTGILWFDTFERVSWEHVGYWILHELPQAVPQFFIVIAGRPEPTDDACPSEGELVRHIPLKGLLPQDALGFFASRAAGGAQEPTLPFGPDLPLPVPPTHEVLKELYDKLEGHPLKLDLAILWLKTGIQTIDELRSCLTEGTLDEELLKPLRQLGRIPGIIPDNVPHPQRTDMEVAAFEVILLMAYLNRRFDERFLEQVYTLPHPSLAQAKQVMSRLTRMYFVKERLGSVLQLHDEMERLVIDFLWKDRDPTGDFRRELAQGAIELYDKLIKAALVEREKEELNAERLGYQLRVDVQTGYQAFVEAFDRNLEKKDFGMCELLLIELAPYEDSLAWQEKEQVSERRFELALARQDFDLAEELIQTPQQKIQYRLGLHAAIWKTQPERAKQLLLEAQEIIEQEMQT